MASGIYTITCTSNGKVYVGSAVDYAARRRLHLHHLRKGVHHSKKLQRAFCKHGEGAFLFSLVVECRKEDLIAEEQRLIDTIRPWFNATPKAGSRLGSKASAETREKLRISHLGKKPTPQHAENHRRAMIAYASAPEAREKLSRAAKGRKQPKEEIERRTISLLGKVRDADARAVMRNAQRLRRGLSVDEAFVISSFSGCGTVRGVSKITGYGRRLIREVLAREGLL